MNSPLLLRNVLLAEQSRKSGKQCPNSHTFPGHEARMAGHIARVRAHPCPCGSGAPFGDCCLGKCRCKRCGKVFLLPDNGPETCPACGSDKVVAMQLKEVCG